MNDLQNDFISGIGNTPLIKLRAASEITGCNIFGKAEFLNPGGSVKDRAALALIKDAQEKKLIAKGGTVVEGTAGNTGIGLGLLGNSLGYKTIIVMNDNQTQEKKDLLRNLGAELRLVPPKPYKDDNNFVKVAARLADELRPTNNNGVIWANQFDNTANAKGHYEGTGQEIWVQTEGKVDGFVCSSGTGGIGAAAARVLRGRAGGTSGDLAGHRGCLRPDDKGARVPSDRLPGKPEELPVCTDPCRGRTESRYPHLRVRGHLAHTADCADQLPCGARADLGSERPGLAVLYRGRKPH